MTIVTVNLLSSLVLETDRDLTVRTFVSLSVNVRLVKYMRISGACKIVPFEDSMGTEPDDAVVDVLTGAAVDELAGAAVEDT